MIQDTLDVASVISRAVHGETAGEAMAKNVRALPTIPVSHALTVETIEEKVFEVTITPGPFPLMRAVVSKEGAAEHIRNALQALKPLWEDAEDEAVAATLQGVGQRLDKALADLGSL